KEVDTDVTFIDEDENKVDPDKHEGKLFVQVDWLIDNDSLEAGDKADIHLSISEKIELMSDQSGKLELEDKEVATYDADAEGNKKSTRLNSSHVSISYAVVCLKKNMTTRVR